MSTINNNLMAANVANNLNAHYGRLVTSVQRLSSGLRINSSADDAAGLAIRELMRADVAALNQGVRNANDAISMLQVADGALAIIDEKLTRMKELAEQAATGTYNSTQRLIIDSEYQAMADEIDRIARATNFNGIHLLDGSLSGKHNGAGLQAQGAMKIHFGSANDSAEDYYYVAIGDCTAVALGVGAGATQSGQQITYIKVEKQETTQATITLSEKVDVFVGPDGRDYYKVGDIYCQYVSDPYRYQVTDEAFIAQFTRKQHEIRTTINYVGYEDPNTGIEYYLGNGSYTSDPYDPVGKRLDAANPDHADILNRLVRSPGNKTLRVDINWKVWSDPQGLRYYSYDNGATFVADTSKPSTGVLDKNNAADAAVINNFDVVLGEYAPSLPPVDVVYMEWKDPQTKKIYYSKDGVTFVSNMNDPLSALDPTKDKAILDRLEMSLSYTFTNVTYNTYLNPTTGQRYYTTDNITWLLRPTDPSAGSLNINNSADALVIANLQPFADNISYAMTCAVYQDPSDNNKRYYSWDYGRTYFSDLTDPSGSSFAADDPAYAGLVANFNKISSTVTVNQAFTTYYDEITLTKYYSIDGGKSFYLDPKNPSTFVDPASGNNAAILGRLKIYPREQTFSTHFYHYIDPVTGKSYYTPDNRNTFYDRSDLKTPVLSASNPTDKDVIDRLQGDQQGWVHMEYADSFPELSVYTYNGRYYYSADGGQTFAISASDPYRRHLDPSKPADKTILDSLKPVMTTKTTVEYIKQVTDNGEVAGDGAVISTQESAQKALAAIDRAIVSKDKIRAHLGALQNRLENTITNLNIQAENMQNAESRISDADVANEMTTFVRNQILTQSAVAMLGQANSYPHMLMGLING